MNAMHEAGSVGAGKPPKLPDQVAAGMRFAHESKRTERAYDNRIEMFPSSCLIDDPRAEHDPDVLIGSTIRINSYRCEIIGITSYCKSERTGQTASLSHSGVKVVGWRLAGCRAA